MDRTGKYSQQLPERSLSDIRGLKPTESIWEKFEGLMEGPSTLALKHIPIEYWKFQSFSFMILALLNT